MLDDSDASDPHGEVHHLAGNEHLLGCGEAAEAGRGPNREPAPDRHSLTGVQADASHACLVRRVAAAARPRRGWPAGPRRGLQPLVAPELQQLTSAFGTTSSRSAADRAASRAARHPRPLAPHVDGVAGRIKNPRIPGRGSDRTSISPASTGVEPGPIALGSTAGIRDAPDLGSIQRSGNFRWTVPATMPEPSSVLRTERPAVNGAGSLAVKLLLAPMCRTDLAECTQIELVSVRDCDPTGTSSAQGGGADALFQQCPLSQDCSRTDLSNAGTVDLDVEDAVEKKKDRVAGSALFDQRLPGA